MTEHNQVLKISELINCLHYKKKEIYFLQCMSGTDLSPKPTNVEASMWGEWKTYLRLNQVFKRMLLAVK